MTDRAASADVRQDLGGLQVHGAQRRGSVGIVITTYNHACFLHDALSSVTAQRVRADAVVVVDDGSQDDPGSIVAGYPGVGLIRQANRGLSAARNAGLAALDTTHVIFLDADDRLEPGAIEAGLACFARAPQSGLVYGGHFYMNRDGDVTGRRFEPPGESAYRSLLRGNFIAMHGAVMYRRECLVALGGFDERLVRCEDYDLYLRMARAYPITGYPEFVASYRQHGTNMSADHWTMLQSALAVQARHAPAAADRRDHDAWVAGRRRWRRCYAEEMAFARYRARQDGATLASTLPALVRIARAAPMVAAAESIGGLRRRMGRLLPPRYRPRVMGSRDAAPGMGQVRFGDLRRTIPISRDFGFDRGQPIDRLYIERFLERNAAAIGGRVLEIGDDTYTRRFGGDRVSSVDILHVHGGNPRATIVGDLTDPRVLPADTYDCIGTDADAPPRVDRACRGAVSPPGARAGRCGARHGARHQPDRPGRVARDVVLVVHGRIARAAVRRSVRRRPGDGGALRERLRCDGIPSRPGGRGRCRRRSGTDRRCLSGHRRRARAQAGCVKCRQSSRASLDACIRRDRARSS